MEEYNSPNNKNDNRWFCVVICGLLILNPLSHFLSNLYSNQGLTYYISYLCWTILFISLSLVNKFYAKKNIIFVALIMILSSVLGALWGEHYLKSGFSNLHVAFFNSLAIVCSLGFEIKTKLSKKELELILSVIMIAAVIASIYAMIIQTDSIIGTLQHRNIALCSWGYKSFFSQRNIFAGYLFLGLCATINLCNLHFNRIYVVITILLFFNMYITNSRTSLLASVILLGMNYYLKHKNNRVLLLFWAFIIFILAFLLDINTFITNTFVSQHSGNNTDSFSERKDMWTYSMEYLFANYAWMFGFGWNSISELLMPVFGVGSNHNTYIDAFFSGGFVYILILLFCYRNMLKIYNSINDRDYKLSIISSFFAFIVYGITEAGMGLFQSNYHSITASFLLVLIPKLFEVNDNNETVNNM